MAGRRINNHCYDRSGRDDAVGPFRGPEGPCPSHEMDSRRRRGRRRPKYWFSYIAQELARYVCQDFCWTIIGLFKKSGRCENKGSGRISTSARACGPHGFIFYGFVQRTSSTRARERPAWPPGTGKLNTHWLSDESARARAMKASRFSVGRPFCF